MLFVEMQDPLVAVFGSESATRVLLHLFHYGEIHAQAIADDYGSSSSTSYGRILMRLEAAGILVSQLHGRTRLFRFNPKSRLATSLKEFVGTAYEMIPLKAREEIFGARRRPRRPGKPVLRGVDRES